MVVRRNFRDELTDGLRDHERNQSEGLSIQRSAVAELERIHQRLAVRPTEVQVTPTATVLSRMSSRLSALHEAQTATTEAIETHGAATTEAITDLHEDLEARAEEAYGQNEALMDMEGEGIEQRAQMIDHLGGIEEGVDAISGKMNLAIAGIGATVFGIYKVHGELEEANENLQWIGGELQEANTNLEWIGENAQEISENTATLVEQGEASLEQQEITNHRLRQIVQQFIAARGEMIDFRKLVHWYFQNYLAILRENNALVENLTNEVVVAKIAIASEIRALQKGVSDALTNVVTGAIQQGNQLLGQLVNLTEHQLENTALQHFRDGRNCLITAEDEQDLQDAYEAFIEGTNANKSSVENHMGAGLAAEKLGRHDQAKAHYSKAGKRASKKQAELASQAYELKAKIEGDEEENFPAAIATIAQAVTRNPQSISASLAEIKYRIRGEKVEELAPKMVQLMSIASEQLFPHIASEPLYKTLSEQKRREVVEVVWKSGRITSPNVSIYVLQEMLETKSGAIKGPLELLLKLRPQILLEYSVWVMPGFAEQRGLIQQIVRAFLQNEKTYIDQHKTIVQQFLQAIKVT